MKATKAKDINISQKNKSGIGSLNVLAEFSRLIENPETTQQSILQECMNLIHNASQSPANTSVRISYKNSEFKTTNFRKSKISLSSEILIDGKPAGTIEIYKQKAGVDKDPFSNEEILITKSLSICLSIYLSSIDVRKQIQESFSFINKSMNQSPFAMWISDKNGVVVQTNQALRNILQATDEQIVGKYNVLEDNNLIETGVMPQVKAVFKNKIPTRFTIPWYSRKGGPEEFRGIRDFLWIDAAIFPITDGKGNLLNVVCQWVDITEMNKARDVIAESEIKFRWLYQKAPTPYHILNPDGVITDINQRWSEVLGYSKEEVVGKEIFQFIAEDEREEARISFNDKKRSKQTYIEGSKRKYITKKGAIRIFKSHDFYVYTKDKQLLEIQTTIEDQTDIDKAYEKLQISENRYRGVVENAPLLITNFLPDGTITFINKTYCKFFRKKYEELIGTNIQSIITKDNLDNVIENLQSIDKDSPVLISEIQHIRGSEFRWVRWTIHAFYNEKEEITNYQAFGQDITNEKIAQQKLNLEHKRAQEYLDISDVMFVALDEKGEIILVNKKGLNILGYEKNELIGKNWFTTCIRKKDRKEVREAFEQIISSDSLLNENYENHILTKAGNTRIIGWHNIPLKNENGKIVGTLSSGKDITELKRSETLLNTLNQAVFSMQKVLTLQEIFNITVEHLKKLDISCYMFPVDEINGLIYTKYLSYASKSLSTVEKLLGVDHSEFSFLIDQVDNFQPVIREKKTVYSEDAELMVNQILPGISKKITKQIVELLHIQKSITAPLIIEGKVIGLFSVQSDELLTEDAPAFTSFANQLAAAWHKTSLVEKLGKALEGTIHTLALTVGARDPYTSGHQARVADLVEAISKELELSADRIKGLHMAGLVHDLGKIYVPAEILSKPGKLTDLDYQIIKTHPQVGYDLLKDIESPWPIAKIVLQHHERMNGSGYPNGIKGKDIIFDARILAVADVVEAMSSHRPYRPALGIDKALGQIKMDRGKLFDPDVVDACLSVFKKGYKFLETKNAYGDYF